MLYLQTYCIKKDQKQTFFKQKCHAVNDHCAPYANSHRFAKTHTQKQKVTQVATSFRHATEVWR